MSLPKTRTEVLTQACFWLMAHEGVMVPGSCLIMVHGSWPMAYPVVALFVCLVVALLGWLGSLFQIIWTCMDKKYDPSSLLISMVVEVWSLFSIAVGDTQPFGATSFRKNCTQQGLGSCRQLLGFCRQRLGPCRQWHEIKPECFHMSVCTFLHEVKLAHSNLSPSNFNNTCARASLSFWNLSSQFSYSSLTSLWIRSSTSSNFDAVCGRNELVIFFTISSKVCLASPVWWSICCRACLECIPRSWLSASLSSYETNEGLHMYIWGEESKNLEASWTTQFLGRRTSQANKLLNGNKIVNRFT